MCIYGLVLIAIVLWQEKLLFPGTKLDDSHQFINLPGLKETFIDVNGGTISALHFQQPDAKGLLFFLHGNVGNLSIWVPDVDYYKQEKYDLFMIDYRGYGKSTGRIKSQSQIENDVLAAWQSIAPQYQKNNLPIVIYGRSIGTYFATKLAITVKNHLLVLVSPYHSMKSLLKQRFPLLPSFILRYPLLTDNIIEQVSVPVLLLHGSEDKLIPLSHAETLSKIATDSQLVVVKNAAHNDIHNFKTYNEAISNALP